jgi:hypothetical protein
MVGFRRPIDGLLLNGFGAEHGIGIIAEKADPRARTPKMGMALGSLA